MNQPLKTLALSFALLTGVSGCATRTTTNTPSSTSGSTNEATVETTVETTISPTQESDTTTSTDQTTLVVYFSATGNTEAVAEAIVDLTGADVFVIEPRQPYTSDDLNWNDENSRVSREHDDASLQTVDLVTTTPQNWDDYTTVFLGYPIWWGNAAWPVSTFVAANDFTNKTVIPFCTSSSSSLGESAINLANLATNGNWLEGQRFSSRFDQEQIENWIGSLDLDQTNA